MRTLRLCGEEKNMRTLDQNKRIWKLVSNFAGATGFTRDYASERMHDICEEISGKRSSSQLTVDQAEELIGKLQGIIRDARSNCQLPTANRQLKSDPEALATNPQLDTLNKLFIDVGIDTDFRQMRFCQRVIKSSIPITRGEVAKVHEALEAMYVRRFTPADIDNMLAAAMRFQDRFTAWEKTFIDDLCHQVNTNKFRKLSSMKLKKLREIYNKVGNRQ